MKRAGVALAVALVLSLLFPVAQARAEQTPLALWPTEAIAGEGIEVKLALSSPPDELTLFYRGKPLSFDQVLGGGVMAGKKISGKWYITLKTLPGKTFFFANFTIPASDPGGWGRVEIRDAKQKSLARGYVYVKKRTFTISPLQGALGTWVVVWGEDYPVGEVIQIYWEGILVSASRPLSGAFLANLQVPAWAKPGRNLIKVVSTGLTSKLYFDFLPLVLNVLPGSASPGQKVVVEGERFLPFTPIQIELDSFPLFSPFAVVDGKGSFRVEFLVPNFAPRDYLLRVLGETRIFSIVKPKPMIEEVLASISGKYQMVWTFDTKTKKWSSYDPLAPEVSSLKELKRGQGYWILALEDCQLVAPTIVYQLRKGWNSIGWLGD